jgi:hypothetical protein
MSPWWSDQSAGLWGGIAGSAIGIMGGIFGTLAGVYAPRGKCKTLVYSIMTFMLAAGVATFIAAWAAISMHQPYGVWYPLMLCGSLVTILFGMAVPIVRYRYRQADARKLEAEELRRG